MSSGPGLPPGWGLRWRVDYSFRREGGTGASGTCGGDRFHHIVGDVVRAAVGADDELGRRRERAAGPLDI